MQIAFSELFSVNIYHLFYDSTIGEEFEVHPTASCRKQMKNYGLAFNKTSKGFSVHYEYLPSSEDGLPAVTDIPLKPIEEDVTFSFVLKTSNPYIMNFSNLPLSRRGKKYYFHNLNDNVQGSEEAKKLLLTSDSTSQFVTNADGVTIKPLEFVFWHESSNASGELEIRDIYGNIVVRETLTLKKAKASDTKGVFEYTINLARHGSAKYALKFTETGNTIESVFYADNELMGQNVFGVIDIFSNPHVPVNYRLVDASDNYKVKNKNFDIWFENRKTFWHYNVIFKYASNVEYSQLKAEHAAVTFKNPTELTAPDGTKGALIQTSTSVALQQTPIKGIKLKKTGTSSSKFPEIKDLPNASITSIKQDANDESVYYSEIFVYV